MTEGQGSESRRLGAMDAGFALSRLWQPAPENPLNRDCVEVDVVETADVHTPDVFGCARAAKRHDAAGRAEVIAGDMGVDLVENEIVEWREQAQGVRRHTVDQGAALAADRTVADANMIKIRIDLELNLAAMT